MSETKFTKGEWYSHPNGVGCGGIAIVNTPNGCVIPAFEDAANQELIAAAPDMYAMLNFIENNPSELNVIHIRKLLAKARGDK